MVTHRRATPADAPAVAALTVASIRAYLWFAPEGWTPPGDEAERQLTGELARRLAASAWGVVAEDGGALAGVAHSARLFTPAGQTRSRRFYEREGWATVAPPFFDERIGFDVVEYRRLLPVTGS